ncbi:5-oxoprolinase subunit PxpB [Robbsia sp. KACC 23696]|uniref:5-oxoprolinase subunit PxpB n=1 Tax=Robbsia sp. KACC 23696 TaxID=3149231 RepID=UPI00325ADD19
MTVHVHDKTIRSDALLIQHLGSEALLCEHIGALDLALQARFWAFAESVAAWDHVAEVVPGMNNLMVVLRPSCSSPEGVAAQLAQAWPAVLPATVCGAVVEVPVDYGGEGGPDLHAVARHAGLSVHEVAEIHASRDYTVYCLGAHPGFGYLGGLDARIHTPRLDKPRFNVPAGSVAIGGMQTGIIAAEGPSGWQLIGRATLDFFDPHRTPPTLLSPGDTVRFRINRVVA